VTYKDKILFDNSLVFEDMINQRLVASIILETEGNPVIKSKKNLLLNNNEIILNSFF
jgi:hypothetical protein